MSAEEMRGVLNGWVTGGEKIVGVTGGIPMTSVQLLRPKSAHHIQVELCSYKPFGTKESIIGKQAAFKLFSSAETIL